MEYGRLGDTGLMVYYIDLYQVHCWDGVTPLEETLSALTDLVRSGKVRYVGVSNFTGWQLMKSVCVSEENGFERFVCLQPQYSLVERNIEREILPICLEEGLGVIPWSPLGFSRGSTGATRSRQRDRESAKPWSQWRNTGTGAPQIATGPRWTW
jgi:aryl-alcohol dehydrogenase-like predicted oxidoreductase